MRLINVRDKNIVIIALSNDRAIILLGVTFLLSDCQFCFLSDQYYKDFPSHKLMQNKEYVDGKAINRPCFFVFRDAMYDEIFWVVPISSKYDKYKKIYDKNIKKYGRCKFICFGQVLGKQASFLIQNMCPVTQKYIKEVYVDKNNVPIMIDNRTIQEVIKNAKDVLAKVNRGSKLIFPDVKTIYNTLIQTL